MPPAEIIEHLTERGCQDLTSDLDPSSSSDQPVSQGGYGSVYRQRLLDGKRVAIKALRVPLDDDDEADRLPKRAARELYIWSKCQHTNVLPLLGLVLFQGQIRMASLWAENGGLPSYLEKHPDTDRCDMSIQICDGLAYLHRTGIIHGDLKGNNVLVSEQGVPVITDFGNAVLEQGTMQFTETMKQSGFTPRWTAPEILDDLVKQSKEADVWALGMTVLVWIYLRTVFVKTSERTLQEIMTGKLPYYYIRSIVALIRTVAIKNEAPKRPEESIPSNSLQGDALWLLLMSCWEQEPNKRPEAEQVAKTMKDVTRDGLMPIQTAPEQEPEQEQELVTE
ncbi:hypothetical protein FRC09_005273 [Ceratobasidium sp. 395]|nr:hypothetical protein FRC09_005273 [Ceratobasidium sp. 395]